MEVIGVRQAVGIMLVIEKPVKSDVMARCANSFHTQNSLKMAVSGHF